MLGKLEILGPVTQFNGPFRYTHPDGTVVMFGTIEQMTNMCPALFCSYATSLSRPDGTVLDFAYQTQSSGVKRLKSVANNRGYVIGFDYAPISSSPVSKACVANRAAFPVNLADVCASAISSATYSYANLTYGNGSIAYTDVMGGVTSFSYSNYLLTSITPPGTSSPLVTIQYMQPSKKVQRQDYADGTYRTYSYETNLDPTDYPNAGTGWTEVSGPGAGVRKYEWSPLGSSVISSCRDENLRTTTRSITWVNGLALPTSEALPEGNGAAYTYGSRQVPVQTTYTPKPGSGLANRSVSRTYLASVGSSYFCTIPGACDSPLSETDAKGATTNWTYDPVHAGVLKKTLPPDPAGVRPETRYSYAQKYAWLKSGSGFVQAAAPIWVLASEEFCRTSATDANGNCGAGSADEVVTTYEYEPGSATRGSNVLLLGIAVTANGQTLRTCYSFDTSGRRISETSPAANLASCS